MQETSKAQILKPKHSSARDSSAPHVLSRIKHHVQVDVMRPTKMLLTEPIVLSLTIYTAYAYALIFSFFDSLPYVLATYYGFNAKQVGLSFLSVVIGYLLATAFTCSVREDSLQEGERGCERVASAGASVVLGAVREYVSACRPVLVS